MDEDFYVIPFLLEVIALILEDGAEAVAHLLCDVAADFLHDGVALQIAAAYVERYVGTVNDTMEEREEFRNDTLDGIRDEDLIAVELYLVALQLNAVLDLGEVKNTCQVEGIVNVEVNPEQGLIAHGEEVTVESLVIIVLEVGGLFRPKRFHIVYYVILVGIYLLPVLPFCFLAEGYWYRQEMTVFAQ